MSQFHSFLHLSDRLRETDTIPGIIVPQRMLPTIRPQSDNDGNSFVMFYSPEGQTAVHGLVGKGLRWQRRPETYHLKLGVRLQDALKLAGPELGHDTLRQDELFRTSKPLEFMLRWPGHNIALYSATRTDGSWSAPELVYEVAKSVQEFYANAKSHEYGDRLESAWSPDAIPFEKLYLVQLWHVGKEIFQPVLAYDAD